MAPSAEHYRLLIVNPNTSQHMTDALRPVVDGLGYEDVTIDYFTSPTPGIPSINSPSDAQKSADYCLPTLLPLIAQYDAFLIACYSQHPLVSILQDHIDWAKTSGGHGSQQQQKTTTTTTTTTTEIQEKVTEEKEQVNEKSQQHQQQQQQQKHPHNRRKYVTGIFEASVNASLLLTGSIPHTGFGIVSTGKIWESALQTAVEEFVGARRPSRFVGCFTTGLNASELHDLPAIKVRQAMMQATKHLIKDGQSRPVYVKAICLGCAGMVGLEESVRAACVDALGEKNGNSVAIVDGVKVGVAQLIGLLKAGM